MRVIVDALPDFYRIQIRRPQLPGLDVREARQHGERQDGHRHSHHVARLQPAMHKSAKQPLGPGWLWIARKPLGNRSRPHRRVMQNARHQLGRRLGCGHALEKRRHARDVGGQLLAAPRIRTGGSRAQSSPRRGVFRPRSRTAGFRALRTSYTNLLSAKHLSQLGAPAIQSRLHRSFRNVQDLRDLPIF